MLEGAETSYTVLELGEQNVFRKQNRFSFSFLQISICGAQKHMDEWWLFAPIVTEVTVYAEQVITGWDAGEQERWLDWWKPGVIAEQTQRLVNNEKQPIKDRKRSELLTVVKIADTGILTDIVWKIIDNFSISLFYTI